MRHSKRNLTLALTLAAGVVLSEGSVLADQLPERKPGLWEIKIESAGYAQVMKQCTDQATDKQLMDAGTGMSEKMGLKCSKKTFEKKGNDFVGESDCTMGTSRAITKTKFSGDFTSSYVGEVDASYDPPMMGMKEAKTTITSKYLGACEAGQVPGDTILPNGMKMNMTKPGALPVPPS